MEGFRIIVFDMMKCVFFLIFIGLAVSLVVYNTKRIASVFRDIRELTRKEFFSALLALSYRQFSSIVALGLLNFVARQFFSENLFKLISTVFIKTVSLLETSKIGFGLLILLCLIAVPWSVNAVLVAKKDIRNKRLQLYLFGIAALSCLFTIILSNIVPLTLDSLINIIFEANPYFGTAVVALFFLVLLDEKPRKSKVKVKKEAVDSIE